MRGVVSSSSSRMNSGVSVKTIDPKGNNYTYSDDMGQVFTPDLFVPEHLATPSGILDHNGNMIYHPPRRIGFL
jgi:hypothetical protein